ncbi:hypothetical protein K402DRAFT_334379 [Aulographum hederae CBS 113979]|uniref:non-specific serine/threonine protein kinase n=1 Tax=Aulographum hederae CBS 113979 TaxID=1176131 RepID=A0A6G1GWY7_9PEZI|nr:hypothetical protein K402DRAFT_334379 [Aulographum hederae CBS 113979]
MPFSTWTSSLSTTFHISKIAEASYSEVYLLTRKTPLPASSSALNSVVLKIIQLRPQLTTKERAKTSKTRLRQIKDNMTSVDRVVSEVQIMQRMACVPGFTDFRAMRVLRGRPEGRIVEAWREWNDKRDEEEKSEFPDPGAKSSYDEGQLWCAIEMGNAGTSLEDLEVTDAFCGWDVFWGVALALGKAECEARFEHRDLHLGNVCIRSKSCRPAEASILRAPSKINLDRNLSFTDIETTIIDCTLSRAEMLSPSQDSTTSLTSPSAFASEPSVSQALQDPAQTSYSDLEKEAWLFKQSSEDDEQYDYYRYMRSAVFFSDPLLEVNARKNKEIKGSDTGWRDYHPLTNVVWLEFLLGRLVGGLDDTSGDMEKENEKTDNTEDDRTIKAKELLERLKEVMEMINLENLGTEGAIGSVGEVVEWALGRGWLDLEDIVGLSGEEIEAGAADDGLEEIVEKVKAVKL